MERLVETLTQELEDQFRVNRVIGCHPCMPMMLLYMGDTAFQARRDMTSALRAMWRNRCDRICQFLVKEDGFYQIDEDGINEISVETFQEKYDQMYEDGEGFSDLNRFLLCMLFDTKDYYSPEDFQQSYKRVETFKEMLDRQDCLTMSIILLDESTAVKKTTTTIKNWLCASQQNEPLYRSTILLSNRLYNGGVVRKETNYALAANLLLLANSRDETNRIEPYSSKLTTFFQGGFLSAAYSRVHKPNHEICQVTVHRILHWLNERLTSDSELSPDATGEEIGVSAFVEKYFSDHIQGTLPRKEELEYLPRLGGERKQISSLPYEKVREITAGSIDVFCERAREAALVPFNETEFAKEFYASLSERLSVEEASKLRTDSMIEAVMKRALPAATSEAEPCYQFFLLETRREFYSKALPLCEKQLQQYAEMARKRVRELQQTLQSFQNVYSVQNEGVKRKYEAIVDGFFERTANQSSVAQALNDAMKEGTSLKELTGELAESIFEGDEIFRASLVKEMTVRIGSDPEKIRQTIQDELRKDIAERVRIRTIVAPDRVNETIIMNVADGEGKPTGLYQYLKNLPGGERVRFLDSGNNDAIEIIQLYRCARLMI